MRVLLTASLAGLLAAPVPVPAEAAQLDLDIVIPDLPVAEYHRPYVGIWIERPDQSVVANLALWYDHDMKADEGTKWLKDLRQWWRRIGRTLDSTQIDGVTGATRAPGDHTVSFALGSPALPDLPAGDYAVVVEAARELGGRELLRLPFTWPGEGAAPVEVAIETTGEHELGRLVLHLAP